MKTADQSGLVALKTTRPVHRAQLRKHKATHLCNQVQHITCEVHQWKRFAQSRGVSLCATPTT
jgi:hypothetical protein